MVAALGCACAPEPASSPTVEPGGARASAAPEPPPIEPLALLPHDALLLLAVDLERVWKSAMWVAMTESSPDGPDAIVGGTVLAMSKGGVGREAWDTVTVAVRERDRAAVLQGETLGRGDTLECIAAQVEQVSGLGRWTLSADGRVVDIEGGDAAFVVDDDTLLMVSPGWRDQVDALLRGGGRSARTGPLAELLSNRAQDRTMWVVGWVPADTATFITASTGVAAPRELNGWIDIDEDSTASLDLGFASAQDAAQAEDFLAAQLEVLLGVGERALVPHAVLDSIRHTTKQRWLTVTARVTLADYHALGRNLMGPMDGFDPENRSVTYDAETGEVIERSGDPPPP